MASAEDIGIIEDHDEALGRAQRRLLRRLFNGRTQPIIVDGRPFLTYKDASRYLSSLTGEEREHAYLQMRAGAADGLR